MPVREMTPNDIQALTAAVGMIVVAGWNNRGMFLVLYDDNGKPVVYKEGSE